MSSAPVEFVKTSVTWSIVLGMIMIVAGLSAIASPMAAGVAVNLLVAWLLILSGFAHLAFAWFTRSAGGFLWEMLLGLLCLAIGIYLLLHPMAGLASLTIALAIYLFTEAFLEFVLGFALRPIPGSGWFLFDGIVTLFLAILIWRSWPSSSEWAVGTLVGISILFSGISRVALSLAARRFTSKLA